MKYQEEEIGNCHNATTLWRIWDGEHLGKPNNLWKLQWIFHTLDLLAAIFIKLNEIENCTSVFTSGLWKLLDHKLTVHSRKSNFQCSQKAMMFMSVLAILLELLSENHAKEILFSTEELILKAIRMDHDTTLKTPHLKYRANHVKRWNKDLVAEMGVYPYTRQTKSRNMCWSYGCISTLFNI